MTTKALPSIAAVVAADSRGSITASIRRYASSSSSCCRASAAAAAAAACMRDAEQRTNMLHLLLKRVAMAILQRTLEACAHLAAAAVLPCLALHCESPMWCCSHGANLNSAAAITAE
jgi:hypothetical protein